MSQLIDNLNTIESIKTDIKAAIENKGLDMTGVSFPGYASKIGEISGGGGVDPSGTLEISENGVYDVYSYASASVNVPQSVTGYTDKDLTEGAVKIINLDNTASFVASYAFQNDNTIKTVNLSYATSVNYGAFRGCQELIQVSLPVCSSIGGYAFYQCTSLSQLSLPVCSSIGDYAFYFCGKLSQLSLPVCSSISGYAFVFCGKLSIITIGYSSVCSLGGSNVFNYTPIASGTGSIYVPASLVDAYKSATNWSYFSTQIFPIE